MRITKRNLKRVIREEARRLAEDHIDTELDNLKKNIGDDLEHIKDLKDDMEDDHEEELRAEKEKEKHEGRRRRRPLSYGQLRRMIREEHGDWGMGKGEESRTRPGEEDYTGHAGDLSKTHPGEDYEGDDVEHKAHTALAAIQDLASAAGVELDTSEADPSDEESEEVSMLAVESRRRRALKHQLSTVIRKTLRNRR